MSVAPIARQNASAESALSLRVEPCGAFSSGTHLTLRVFVQQAFLLAKYAMRREHFIKCSFSGGLILATEVSKGLKIRSEAGVLGAFDKKKL
jgi:hypothetical protein